MKSLIPCSLLFLLTTNFALAQIPAWPPVNNTAGVYPTDKVFSIVDSAGVRVQKDGGGARVTPFGLELYADSAIDAHYPIRFNPPNPHSDNVPFLFNMNSTPQLPYAANNNVMMFGWNIGVGGSNYIPGRPGVGFSLESNFHPGGDSNTTWVESHEFYLRPTGEQVRLKSYTIGVPPGSPFIDLYHTVDNFHLRDEGIYDYLIVNRNRENGNVVQKLYGVGEANLLIGRTDVPQSIQFQVLNDRVNIIGESKIIALPKTTEWYLGAENVGGLNTGYGLNAGSGINAVGEMENRMVQYQLYTNKGSDFPNRAVLNIGAYTGNFEGAKNMLTIYNNGIVAIHKQWQAYSGLASVEVGKKEGAKTPLKLDDLPLYLSNDDAIAHGLTPGCLYIREGHGLDVVVDPSSSRKTLTASAVKNQ